MLEIKNLKVSVEGKKILQGVTLTIEPGKVYALMGPNGSGKSTLAQALMGHPKYKIDSGKIILDGKEITRLSPEERARLGLFLSFQYPQEISGVTLSHFLRAAYNSVKAKKLSVLEFHQRLQEKLNLLQVPEGFSQRYVNEGFSGGEKKKAEMVQMLVLEPKFAILDETDSGTDVDALKIISVGINKIKEEVNTGILLITHYNRILKYIRPDKVIVLVKGKVVDTGEAQLAEQIEASGYGKYGVKNDQ